MALDVIPEMNLDIILQIILLVPGDRGIVFGMDGYFIIFNIR